ncbi:MAG: 2,3-bisphosphoglycerate-independent phosphoglycerate mutase [Peptoniphilus sp.]|uniref:2,3-bisphosphoglycerate-independent phosphoglycerate mutase n=1 Tax=Peptoniphilus sp. TaxID=1971214 RepID=UPI002A760D64|nr:2,3-bisphosphoglycerate-independent phosphoglycerate mutase [Peptoniphilus sp.]MDY2987240.1 2,3-bisphosphoglycerate-independent phosphoglycerate mutase [Peptoniphilus sp.]
MKSKIILMIADGLGDRACESLGYLTPLQYAKKENLNYLAKNGSCGLMDLYKSGVPVGTDLGHMILFGYSLKDYPGRGPIEAFGNDMDLKAGDIAFRCNFGTVDKNGVVIDRRAGRIREGTRALAEAINGMEIEGVKVMFKEATEHRAVLILRGENLSDKITDTDPKKEGLKVVTPTSKDGSESSKFTASVLEKIQKEFYKILNFHEVNVKRESEGKFKANFILTRGAGLMPKLDKTAEIYGVKAACVAAESTVLGVAKLAGFDTIYDDSFTGNIDTNIDLKSKLAVEALKTNDFVVLHYKATDLMGHDNNPIKKVEAVEIYDKMVGQVLELTKDITDSNIIFALAADHSTPCERREHSGDPVPVVISGKNIRTDIVGIYDEVSVAQGALCRLSGNEFFNTLFDYLEATKKQGN